ncbi:GNAT family N-acetyltransferase [Anaerocolumna sedimenticola]|uniref:GNAT family N-acetyltransferase n=1 Tax=Anaerocolumna sedimenticola TaxID=2696063 RepID=A0A6P1THJ8_9FIRM|nr:GNAT family N-acetyltransferase [Anaerocolumna sedimenticola]QHQ59572.1 GNAT family N-acetyltransferase [Anaerocolumna sedimenticola]
MKQEYFMKTERIGFSHWTETDLEVASWLWGEKDVTRYICATGEFTQQNVLDRLLLEVSNDKKYHVQYWPIFDLKTGELIGCCGLRPFKSEQHSYEIGFHLRRVFWGQGYAFEAAKGVIQYAFSELNAVKLYAGHHPENINSRKLLTRLGFQYIGDNFYEPTGLYHPSYELNLLEL